MTVAQRHQFSLILAMLWRLLIARGTVAFSTAANPLLKSSPHFFRVTGNGWLVRLQRTAFLLSERSDSLNFRLYSSTTPRNNNNGSNNHDNWKVPEYIDIPEENLDFSFVRSSGAGGQNVNKVNSQVQLRLNVNEAYWIPYEVRQRLMQQQANRISKEGVLTIAAQEHRTQVANRKAAIQKLRDMLLQAWPRPKERRIRQGISIKTKEQRKEFKRRRSDVKAGRKKVDF
ncbi:peptidyl-tRNA hydrolase ICT1 [Fistulifera solaris]|uniref:Peptidyl-tRNA hydrolase ICT1 n=1 Tax=Fistulifera solaris TaxID=1519565 RepID=A0A1Z5KFY9_FISSO|nr:peptidyl-tRNA hydrolase ICT1 [Fistulifera solaris]|eukprot:GAX25012.1 peptidyl-tRNA hydrolase ICT1 [Fistulifera solaris]